MPRSTVSDLAKDWLQQSQLQDGDALMYDLLHEEPELAWPVILQILKCELTEDQTALLAAGPLEDLLALHGAGFIDRIEVEAEHNPRFNHLLGGVWQDTMSPGIWDRVQRARKAVW
jgi:Family of unknown function (DUF6869)